MITIDLLKARRERIIQFAADHGAHNVRVFGSVARGEASSTSDVDLLVVAESDLPRFKRSRELYGLFKPYPFGMDILVYTPAEIEKGRKSPLSFLSTVLREGKTLYERNP